MTSSVTAKRERVPQHELVVKSNDLVRARIDWTTIEHRITLKLIAQLRKDDKEFAAQTVRIRDVIELSGSKSNDLYSRAEEICEKLLGQKIRIRDNTADGERRYRGFNLMSACEYVEGTGQIRARFNPDMRPFLLELKRRFTMYRLQFAMRLSSPYAVRFYEILKMREGLHFIHLPVDELREMLCVEHKYHRFTDLKKHVIEPARKEIKETCDVYFTYRVEREGRTPVRVNLMIHSNEEIEPPLVGRSENEQGKRSEAAVGAGPARRGDGGNLPVGDKDPVGDEDAPVPPKVDARQLFLQDFEQEELSGLKDREIDQLYERAKQTAESSNPDGGRMYILSETYRGMRRLWKEEHAEAS